MKYRLENVVIGLPIHVAARLKQRGFVVIEQLGSVKRPATRMNHHTVTVLNRFDLGEPTMAEVVPPRRDGTIIGFENARVCA